MIIIFIILVVAFLIFVFRNENVVTNKKKTLRGFDEIDNGVIDKKVYNEVLSEPKVVEVLNEIHIDSSTEEKIRIYHTTGEDEYYKEYLKDRRWKEKREEIKKRDNYTCRHCFNIKVLSTIDELEEYIDDSSSKIVNAVKQTFNNRVQTLDSLDFAYKCFCKKKVAKYKLSQYLCNAEILNLFSRSKLEFGYLYSDKEEIFNIQVKRYFISLLDEIPYKKKDGIGWTKTLLMTYSPDSTTHGQILLRALFGDRETGFRCNGVDGLEYAGVGQLSLDEYSIFFPLYNLNGFKEQIDVHHLKYGKKDEPWNVENVDLITLCHSCHMAEHDRLKNKYIN